MKEFLMYFINTNPSSAMKYYPIIIGLTVALLVGGTVFSSIYKKRKKEDIAYKKIFKNFGKTSISLGLLLGFLGVVRYESISFLSMRLWLYLTLLGILAFIIYYIRQYKVSYINLKNHIEKNQNRAKSTKRKYTTKKKRK